MLIETVDGGLANCNLLLYIDKKSSNAGRYEVDITLNTTNPATNAVKTVFRSEDESEADSFMEGLKTALGIVQIEGN